MSGVKIKICSVVYVLLFLVVVSNLLPCVYCVDGGDYSQTGNPALLPLITQMIYNRLSNLSTVFSDAILDTSGFCVKNVKADWNGAFDFTGELDFLTNCIKKTKGDLTHRLCTAAEIKFYFKSLFERREAGSNYLKPNKNCNLSSWLSGCEPGWGCSTSQKQKAVMENTKDIPARTQDCQPCCEGFFCPQGLTCMIPCPLGSYCPVAKLNKTTGVCDPYSYQIPPGQPNHTCGAADIWSDVGSASEIFCPPGAYCPTTTLKVPCSSGHYCMTGSTYQKACFKLTTCKSNTANQNLRAYGVILIASLTTLLLIIVNCSDQALSTRERKAAKSREAAARQARETAQARERWKTAKDGAKKRAFGLQQQFSRTFSRQKSRMQPELKGTGQTKHTSDDTSSSATGKTKKNEPTNLTKMMRAIEDDPNSPEGFNIEIGDKNIKKNMPKGKQLHTHSQIFKYAYGQLEKERAMQEQQQNLTFSGIISMATDTDIKTRPVIEVAFKDLTLTLKGKNRHLLRCVTGKIMPGRVSAVMGPSGAGKTTFLSALAGKATGCTMKGSILINGKNEPIHSYKKIIGFVPQDDIVHGNLTVEENLRFNARCRLSDDMPKADKVLVIERVIEALGLQAVRDSLVGTVEKRGISGGQRKRVNVGIEMVMEPSLLILDEPTSGLDSASSQLLLKALRREALEGVNICMVVHQPSYALFKMFDDLILLAKGGITVYHGSAKKVEEYFAGLGIIVPEHVTPPDHYIDILEGIVKPEANVTHEQLPIRWMLHNGYAVPPDMLHLCDGLGAGSTTSNSTEPSAADTEQSFAGDLWQDMKCNVELQKDYIQSNFQKSNDLSNRRTPSVSRQYRYFLGRVGKQRLREARLQAVDYLILLLAGACLGTLTEVDDETFGSTGYTFTVIAISLLCKIAALRSFSLDKLHYWRESASGISSLAYFLSKDTLDHFNTFVKPLVYLSMFYFFNNPRSSFTDNYIVLICLVYCVTGVAYIFAIYLEPSPAQLWSVLLPVVLTLIATQEQQTGLVKHLGSLCYPKWAMEAFIIANAERYSGVWLITRCHSLLESGYDLGHWSLCLELLILTGILCRFIAYFLLVTFQKK
ncbi:putative white-brown complex homolog protein 30 [Ricinus communis]|uniref:putative white-brown complex homolog protein 30 n=1 Tax=Ricinus communis TaxID=3988 RepID=UPI0007726835|nr:putative white-brown complex homolog protein 30 [Ricinus communis]|eukprot:XP_015574815.1 putative white-brown complex homolog protein 30 [Ricinus communis]